MRRRDLLLLTAAAACPLPAWPNQASCSPLFDAATFARIEGARNWRLGLAVHDLHSGQTSTFRADERFMLNSTVKFLLVGLLLQEVAAGHVSLTERITIRDADLVTWSPVTSGFMGQDLSLSALCEATLTQSDNTAANLLIHRLGGPAAVTARLRALDDPMTRLDRFEPDMNNPGTDRASDTTTPAQMLHHLQRFLLGPTLPSPERRQLQAWMEGNQYGDARFRAGVPSNWRVADRTGANLLGDSGTVGLLQPPDRAPILIALYVSGGPWRIADSHAIYADVARQLAARISP